MQNLDKKIKKKRTLLQKSVNVFLYFWLGVLIFLIIAFAISQTSTFREYVRELVIEEANDALNGKLNIEVLDGTFFTSIILYNTSIKMQEDTLFFAKKIEVRTSPLRIFLKTIYARKIEISGAKINLVSDSDGVLNISKLFPPSIDEDTSSSEFPFSIEVADLSLKDVDFSLQSYENRNSIASYDTINMDDFRITDLDLSLSAYTNLKEDEFEIGINHIDMNSNINSFNLRNFSGRFAIVKDHLEVENLNIATTNSDIHISVELTGFDLFDSTAIKNLGSSELKLELQANPFSFSDLSTFVPSVNILNGDIDCAVELSGTVDEILISSLKTEFNNTKISLKGSVKNLTKPEQMYLYADFYDTEIFQPDINYLLPTIKVPVYEEYGILYFDNLHFEGEPLDFKVDFDLKTDRGTFLSKAALNLNSNPVVYDLTFESGNFDISPIAGVNTSLNTKGSIKGSSFSVDQMNAQIVIDGNNSSIENNMLDVISINANAGESKINYTVLVNSDSTQIDLTGSFDFNIMADPKYNFEGNLRHINLAELLRDTTSTTDININLIAEGEGFNPDSMNLFIISTLYESTIGDVRIDTTQAIIDLRRENGEARIINIVSDIADITITGNFSVLETAELMAGEAGLISSVFVDKFNSIVPVEMRIKPDTSTTSTAEGLHFFEVHSESETTLNYVIEFKDFTLLTLFLKGNVLELDGDMSGEFTKTPEDLFFRLNTNLEYVKYWSEESVLLISNIDIDLTLANNFTSTAFDDINTGLKVSIDRIYTGDDYYDISLGLKIKNEIAAIDFSARMSDNLSIGLDGKINLAGNSAKIRIDTLKVMYNQFNIQNKEELSIDYSGESIRINNFVLSPLKGEISLSGYMNTAGSQDIKLNFDKLDLNEIMVGLLNMSANESPEAELNLSASITGEFNSPVMDIESQIDSIEFRNKKFGSLVSNFEYANRNLRINSYFVDELKQFGDAKLNITGDIPIDLSFASVEQRISGSGMISIKLIAEDFNLAALGDILPEVNKLSGILTAEIELEGTKDKLKPSGYLTLESGAFVAEANNLGYTVQAKISVSNDSVKIEQLEIENRPGTKDGGKMIGSGVIALDGLEVAANELYLNGSLKVLGNESKSVSPAVYGDLVIGTKGHIELRTDRTDSYLSAPLQVKVAHLIFPPTQSAYSSGAENFIYRDKVDSGFMIKEKLEFDRLIAEEERKDSRRNVEATSSSNMDYTISIDVENEATIVFVLSKEFNQNLTAVLNGDLLYEMVNGRSLFTGSLKLLEGSTLQFFKSFDASGSIRFDSDLSNPYLNVVATYRDFYIPSDSAAVETEVGVKIKISGPLHDLNKNFIQEKNSIAVYIGADNIEDDISDPTKTQSDAIMFILTGRFASEATAQDKSIAAGQFSGTATSLAGSLLGGVLNTYFGDYVRRVELRTVGAQTKFNLSGRVDNFRYSIGGSTDVFQDLSQANIKIEYPVFRNLLIRLERKDALAETYLSNEMINELGLKYRFEF